MPLSTYAVQITEDNVDAIIEFGAQHKLNLADFRDDIEFNAEDGFETFAVASINVDHDVLVAIHTLTSAGFKQVWVMHPSDQYHHFTRVSRR